MRHFVLLLTLLAAVAVIAGCGSSDSSDTASAPSSSTGTTAPPAEDDGGDEGGTTEDEGGAALQAKSEFISEADEICKRIQEENAPLEARYAQLGESANTPPELKELAGVVRKLLGYAEKGINEVQKLEEPAADTKTIDDYAATINERIAIGKEFANAVEGSRQSEANSLVEKAGKVAEEAETKAKSYGFSVCGIAK